MYSGFRHFSWLALAFLFLVIKGQQAVAYDASRNDNLAVYWGQDSGGDQQSLAQYCSDDTIDAFPMAFLYIFFGEGGKPVIDFANTCSQWAGSTFPGTSLANCQFLADDIKACQKKGKIITISLGGATAEAGFTSDSQASDFAVEIWNMFLGGNSGTRPFGDAVLDGVDLDIENGSSAHYSAFVDKIHSLAKGVSKKIYVTAAPQCPFPDAKIGEALSSSHFDAVYVQFYNNFCGLDQPKDFNFDTWEDWAQNTSPNPDVKVFIGAAAAPSAAGEGYVDIDTITKYITESQEKYDHFGGVMLWDVSEAHSNDRYDLGVKKALTSGPAATKKPKTTSTAAQNAGTKSVAATTVVTQATTTPQRVPRPVLEVKGFSPNHHLSTIPLVRNTTKTTQVETKHEERKKSSRFFKF